MDSTLREIKSVTPKNTYTIFYYKIPVSFGSPYVQLLEIYRCYLKHRHDRPIRWMREVLTKGNGVFRGRRM
jgi:hypothetical protein